MTRLCLIVDLANLRITTTVIFHDVFGQTDYSKTFGICLSWVVVTFEISKYHQTAYSFLLTDILWLFLLVCRCVRLKCRQRVGHKDFLCARGVPFTNTCSCIYVMPRLNPEETCYRDAGSRNWATWCTLAKVQSTFNLYAHAAFLKVDELFLSNCVCGSFGTKDVQAVLKHQNRGLLHLGHRQNKTKQTNKNPSSSMDYKATTSVCWYN